jgi:hypothetical protein
MIRFALSVESSWGYRYTLSDCENVFRPIPVPLVSAVRLVLPRRKIYLLGIANCRRTEAAYIGADHDSLPKQSTKATHFQTLVTH